MPGIDEFTPKFFDDAISAWSKNKVRNGHCMAYMCTAITLQNKKCVRTASMKDGASHPFCKQHQKTVSETR